MHLRIATLAALVVWFWCFAGPSVPADATNGQGAPRSIPADEILARLKSRGARLRFGQPGRLIETIGTYKQDSFMIVRHGRIEKALLVNAIRRAAA
jgi:hypothetical protein